MLPEFRPLSEAVIAHFEQRIAGLEQELATVKTELATARAELVTARKVKGWDLVSGRSMWSVRIASYAFLMKGEHPGGLVPVDCLSTVSGPKKHYKIRHTCLRPNRPCFVRTFAETRCDRGARLNLAQVTRPIAVSPCAQRRSVFPKAVYRFSSSSGCRAEGWALLLRSRSKNQGPCACGF